jgi:hypothetical protein
MMIMKRRNSLGVDYRALCFRLVAACALAGPAAAADSGSPVTEGLKRIEPVPLVCFLRGGQVVYIENSTEGPLAVGSRIFWSTASGDRGMHELLYVLQPGGMVQVGGGRDSTTCSALLYPPVLQAPAGTYQPPPPVGGTYQPPLP